MGLAAPLSEEPRDDEPVAAVLSLADDDGDGLPAQRGEEPLHRPDHRLAGVFHETDAGNAPPFDGGAVQLAHLSGGDEFHRNSPGYRRRSFISRTARSSPTDTARAMMLWPMLYSTISGMDRRRRTFR